MFHLYTPILMITPKAEELAHLPLVTLKVTMIFYYHYAMNKEQLYSKSGTFVATETFYYHDGMN